MSEPAKRVEPKPWRLIGLLGLVGVGLVALVAYLVGPSKPVVQEAEAPGIIPSPEPSEQAELEAAVGEANPDDFADDRLDDRALGL